MRLHRLKLLNFRQHVDTEISFGLGITAIVGPNGAGKSTLLEAIAWALYGSPAARGSREFLRWNRAPARAQVRVELDFGLGAHEFRVARGLYQAELYQDGAERPVANSQQEVTARLERALGMNREEFFNTYFTNQKELAVMARLGPADRARFLSRILGYERLRQAQDLLRSRRSEIRAESQGLEQGMTDEDTLRRERASAQERLETARRRVREAERAKADAERRVKEEGPAWSRMVSLRESVMSLDGERRLAEQRVQEARREFERLDKEMAQALEAQRELKAIAPGLATVGRLREELERLEREAQAANRRRDLTGQMKELGSQILRTEARLAELAGAGEQVKAAEQELAAAHARRKVAEEEEEKARTAWVRDKQDAQTKLDAAREQYRELRVHRQGIEQAGPDGTCPTCLRPLGAEFEAVLGTLTRQLEELELNGKYFSQRVEQLGAEPDQVREAEAAARRAATGVEEALQRAARARERLRDHDELAQELKRQADRRQALEREIAALPDRYDAARHEAVRLALREMEPVVVLEATLKIKADAAERLVGDAETADKTLTERETHLTQLTAAIADAGFSEEAFDRARQRYEAAERASREAELDLSTVRGDLRGAEQLVEAADRRVAERAGRAGRLVELKRDLRLHDELDEAFTDIRTDLNAQMRPELSEIASGFLGELTDGRYAELELDEEYQVLVMEDENPKPVISGGEEDVANLALRLAISQTVAERAGQPLSLLVLDEVFASLDVDRRGHVMSLLQHLRDRFPQVVVLTHVEEMRAGVDRTLRVAVDPASGASVVTEDQGAPLHDVAA
jgi:exonuclease SbcC